MELKDGIWVSNSKGSASYPEQGNSSCYQVEDKSFWFNYRNKIIADSILRHSILAPLKTFLDIGGGNGFVALALQRLGFVTTVLEPGEGANNAKVRGIDSVYRCSLSDFPLDQVFENAGLFDVLEHVEEPVDFLKKVRKHLLEGSKLYLTVPAYSFLWSPEDDHAGHFRRYTLTGLQKELEEAGFSIVHSTYFFSFLVVPIFTLRVIPAYLRSLAGYRNSSSIGGEEALVIKGPAAFVVNVFIWTERNIIKVFGRSPVGASLLVVAEKKEYL